MDGGFRCGADIFKAIALRAEAVLLGRPIVYGLAVAVNFYSIQFVTKLFKDYLNKSICLGTRRREESNRNFTHRV